MAARTLGENFKYQQGPVVDGQLQVALKITLLGRAQGLVKQYFRCADLLGQHLDFVGLAAADKQCRVRRPAFAGDTLDGLKACCLGQQAELFKAVVEIGEAQINPDQNGQRTSARAGTAGKVVGTQLVGLSSESAAAKFTARPGTMVEMACLYTIWVTVLRSRTTY